MRFKLVAALTRYSVFSFQIETSFLDTYDAQLYCTNCHQLQETIIPRNAVLNWDFSLQSGMSDGPDSVIPIASYCAVFEFEQRSSSLFCYVSLAHANPDSCLSSLRYTNFMNMDLGN